MRFAFLAIALAACSSGTDLTPDASSTPDVQLVDVSADTTAPDVTPDVIADAAVDVSADVTPDAAPDVARDVAREVVDAADPCGSATLRTCDVNGHNECVDISAGRVLGGVVVHCGACGVTCSSGEVCAELRCQRL